MITAGTEAASPSVTGREQEKQGCDPVAKPGRILSLDLLRAVAVLLVIGRHVPLPPSVHPVLEVWQRGGWVGVDLFFVLSGFLVSGLLFREYQQHGTVSAKRFLIRRGLKIYPAFYVFLVLTVGLKLYWNETVTRAGLLAEVVFLQNYLGGVWNHTWSLAVEEHFYLAIVGVMVLLLRTTPKNPFSKLPHLLAGLCVLLLIARCATALTPYSNRSHLYPTHLRIDSLGFGVLLAYYWCFLRAQLGVWFRTYRAPALAAALALFVPAFLWTVDETPFVYTFGLTCFYLGSALLLMVLLVNGIPENPLTRLIGYVGGFSYSIYLWHMPVIRWLVPRVEAVTGVTEAPAKVFMAIVGSIIVGIVIGHCVEMPVLHLRDRLFPSRSGKLSG